MKKMQCEVCGSSEIKKIDDTTFECQSCGVQYSKDEVQKLLVEITGEVKIDHSAEVENTIKRAEQYAEEGNNAKAEEYLNKALDMDAENEKAIQRIKEINENKKLSEYSIVAANIDPDENIKSFLKQLATTENIVCDIYKEIEILSVKQQYRPSFYTANKCLCEWSAIACHIYYENETVWKEKYNPNTKKYDKEPVTEKVKKVNRVPENGKFYFNSDGFGFASSAIFDNVKNVDSISKNALLESFEELQADKYDAYRLKKLNSNSVLKKDGKIYYNDYEIDLAIEPSVYSTKIDKILKKGDEIGFAEAGNRVGGDYYENFSATRKVVAHSVQYILIPIQVIEYSYKGDKYIAVSDLVSQTTTITKLYPCDTELAGAKSELSTDSMKANKLTGWFICGIIGFIVGAICLFIAANSTDGDLMGFSAIALWFVSLGLMICGAMISRSRKAKFEQKSRNYKTTLYNPRKAVLSKSYQEFFDVFEKCGVCEEARKAVLSDIIPINETRIELSIAGELKLFVSELENELNEQENEIELMEAEIEELKKKRILPTVIMIVLGVFIIPLFVGAIMLGNVNAKINVKNAELAKLKHEWVDE